MSRHSAWIAPSYAAAFVAGVAVGCWLSRPHDAPPTRRSYDREAASEAEAAKWRATGLRAQLNKRGNGGTA